MSTWKKVVVESTNNNITQNAATATALQTPRDFSLSGEVTATAVAFDGSANVTLAAVLDETSITNQTTITTVDGTNDFLLIYDATDLSLKKVTRDSLVSGLGSMSGFNVEVDSTGTVQVSDGETVNFLSGTGAEFVIGGTSAAPTITVNSVDAEIVHDNLSGFVGNEHIDHSSVTLTAGLGLTGGGDITADRAFNVGAGALIDVAADVVNVDLTAATPATIAAGDFIVFLDGGTNGTHAKGSINDVATLFAGDGLTATNGVIAVDEITLGTDTSGAYTSEVTAGANIAVTPTTTGDATSYAVALQTNVDIAGTLDVTGNATFDADVAVLGNLNITGTINQTNVTELNVTDRTIRVANGATTEVGSDQSGLVVDVSDVAGYANDASILWNKASSDAAFSEWKMTKSAGGTPKDASFVAGMVEAADETALDAIDAGVGTLGMIGGELYLQVA